MTGEARVVDGRGLLPPEPMQRTLEALADLPSGGSVVLLLHREPFPLYDLLDGRGFRHKTVERRDGTFEVHIRHT
jgi:hypothetical protein